MIHALRRATGRAIALAALGAAAGLAVATSVATPAWAQTAVGVDDPLNTAAPNVAILDYETGLLLYGKNADLPIPPASMSKLMTMLMVFEELKDGGLTLETEFTVSEDAWRRGGLPSGSSAMCLIPRERVSVEDLIRGVIILSGNDASITFAEGIAGSEDAFAQRMTDRAQELGLSSAQFANATGWPHPDHRISVRDLTKIAQITIRDHPDFYPIYAEETFDYCTAAPSNRYNRNPLLGVFEGADGLKTGHTSESGYGLVASAERDGVRRIVAFNGLPSEAARVREAERLMRAAFAEFRVHTVFEAGAAVAELPVFLAQAKSVPVYIDDPVVVGYHRRAARNARVRVAYDDPILAPVSQGDVLGELIVEIPGADPQSVPVRAGADVAPLEWRERAVAALVHLVRTVGREE